MGIERPPLRMPGESPSGERGKRLECPTCGHVMFARRAKTIYHCPNCGEVLDRRELWADPDDRI